MREVIELAAEAIEALAVVIIVIAIVDGSVRFLVGLAGKCEVAHERYKIQLGKGLLVGLEFLVAADVEEPWFSNQRCRTS